MLKLLWGWVDSWSSHSDSRTHLAASSRPDSSAIQWFRIFPFILLHFVCLGIFVVGVSWFAVFFMIAFYLVRMFAITAFYHRYLAHKAFETSRILQFIFTLIGTMSAQRGPLWWVAHHRYHHRYTDSDADPHSAKSGFLYSHILWFLNDKNFHVRKNAVRDWLKYPELIWLDRFNMPVVMVTGLCVYILGEWLAGAYPELGTDGAQLFVWGFAVSTVLLIHGTLCINSLGHLFGSRDFETDDQSRNNIWLALITLGEGWHNNHHFYAGSARQGFFWWQLDIVYLILKCMSWFGLVWNLKPVPEKVYQSYRTFAGQPKARIEIE